MVSAAGMTTATPVPRAGQMAPNRETRAKCGLSWIVMEA